MRSLYAERLEVFSDLIHEHSGGRMKAALPDGGMQTVVRSLEGKDDAALLQHLGLAGIDGHPLSGFHLAPERASRHGVLMGFSAWPEAEIRRVLSGLTKLRVS
jgi:DNA-binding transcriptional MocR family regulator